MVIYPVVNVHGEGICSSPEWRPAGTRWENTSWESTWAPEARAHSSLTKLGVWSHPLPKTIRPSYLHKSAGLSKTQTTGGAPAAWRCAMHWHRPNLAGSRSHASASRARCTEQFFLTSKTGLCDLH